MSDEKETISDIVEEMRKVADTYIDGGNDSTVVFEMLSTYSDRIEAAYNRDINKRLRIDNSCVAQCAVLIDDHIKAIVAEVKKSSVDAERYASGRR